MGEFHGSLGHIQYELGRWAFKYATEAELQAGIQRVLEVTEIAHEREAILDEKSRVDFLIGTIGVECKIDGGLSDLTRQVHRYTACDRISAVIVVTSKFQHRRLPRTMNGKPVHVIWLGM